MPTLINTMQQLTHTTKHWETLPEIALDIECENGLHHYGMTLALIQISDHSNTWLIDPIAIKDLSPLIDILVNPNITKVIHDVSFDIRVMDQILHCRPKNIFDTKIGALLLGINNLGLDALLKQFLNITSGINMQKADWTRRPLTPQMIQYAAGDTQHLLKIKDIISQKLQEKKRFNWMIQECEYIENMPLHYPTPSHHDIKGAKTLLPHQRGILEQLYLLRDTLAQKADRPIHFIMSNKQLIELAKNPPTTPLECQQIRGVHPIVRRQANALLNAIQKGSNNPHQHPNTRNKLVSPSSHIIDQLLQARMHIAQDIGIEPYVIISKDDIMRIARKQPHSLRNWQKELISHYIGGWPY